MGRFKCKANSQKSKSSYESISSYFLYKSLPSFISPSDIDKQNDDIIESTHALITHHCLPERILLESLVLKSTSWSSDAFSLGGRIACSRQKQRAACPRHPPPPPQNLQVRSDLSPNQKC